MTLSQAMKQNEGLTNPRFLALAIQAVKELGKFVPTEKVVDHVLSKMKHPENVIDKKELRDAVVAAKREV